ncbi:MAG: hypothetical protein ABI818_19510 [Acidobacteriota bacterium]
MEIVSEHHTAVLVIPVAALVTDEGELAVIGGLSLSTLVTLFLVPTAYLALVGRRRPGPGVTHAGAAEAAL